MKTPDEIKKGLECCAASYADCHKECPYKPDCDGSQILKDALALIQQLEAEREALQKELETVESPCDFCKHLNKEGSEDPCNRCKHIFKGRKSHFEWHGVQKEETT